jgi:cell division protein FtsI (penicillin-binding protein 3)/stage V sporulation protein D (sporulation-specific penicillin-binding protein)
MNSRLLIIGALGTLLVGGIVARLGYLQINQHERFEEIAREQEVPSVFRDAALAKRGSIFARDTFLLASMRREYDLAINPKTLSQPETAFSLLASVVAFERDDFFAKAAKKDDPFEVIKKRLSDEEVHAVRDLLAREQENLIGVLLAPEKKRFYPGGNLLAHVLGFVGADEAGELAGRYGIEQYFEKDLAEGKDITLTIDHNVALFAQQLVELLAEKWQAETAGVVVLEPRSGRVLTMNVAPAFDPNRFYEANIFDFLNPFIQTHIEPGSVIKPLTLAAAIDAGAVTPETTYYDKGYREFDTERINNFDKKGRGTVTMQEVLSQSLNTGAVFAMEKMGKATFRRYAQRFGLGEKTGIALAGEITGDLRNLDSPRMIEFATASFGQGIATTPLGLARALAILANDGKLPELTVIDHRGVSNGVGVIKKETADTITRMLVKVVDTTLAEGKGKIPGYSVAAKTGTAQLPDPVSGGYSEDFLHTFFGYAPAHDPHFLVFLFLKRPQGVTYASHTLTEPFRDMMQFLLATYAIPPDRVE